MQVAKIQTLQITLLRQHFLGFVQNEDPKTKSEDRRPCGLKQRLTGCVTQFQMDLYRDKVNVG